MDETKMKEAFKQVVDEALEKSISEVINPEVAIS